MCEQQLGGVGPRHVHRHQMWGEFDARCSSGYLELGSKTNYQVNKGDRG
jgi:hypothetical protein